MKTLNIKEVHRYKLNTVGEDYIVGDIHGCYDELRAKLDEMSFDNTKDRLFSVGDLADRGAQSEECIDWLAYDWFSPVMGNHESMAIEHAEFGCYQQMITNGGEWFINLSPGTQQVYASAFSRLPLAIEIETSFGLVGIVHAEVIEQNWQTFVQSVENNYGRVITEALWGRTMIQYYPDQVIQGIERVYHGHTPITKKLIQGNRHYIDTGACYGKGLHMERIEASVDGDDEFII